MKQLITLCLFIATLVTANAQDSFTLKRYDENGKIGFLDADGKKITEAKYDKFSHDASYYCDGTFYQGLCRVFINDKMGFIDGKGKEITRIEFSLVNDFTVEGLAAVQKEGKWGFINKKGKKVVPFLYDKVFDFENGKALVILDKKISFIDVKGEKTGDDYWLRGDYNEGSVLLIRNSYGQIGFLDGNTIHPNFYDEIRNFSKNYMMVLKAKKIGFIDMHAKEIIPPIYSEYSNFDGKYFYLWKDLKMGVLDLEGKIIIPFVYGSVGNFNDGLAAVRMDIVYGVNTEGKDEKYGYIDETGKEVIPRKYFYGGPFKDGVAKVRMGEDGQDEFFINTKGGRIR